MYEKDQGANKIVADLVQVLISPFNALGDGRYFDTESSTSFAFDHTTQVSSCLIRDLSRSPNDSHRKPQTRNHIP